jgi:excinuclease UvrABC ATPase subunit
MQKPDVDSTGGLSPAISTGQTMTSRNPRSMVGTVPVSGLHEVPWGPCRANVRIDGL